MLFRSECSKDIRLVAETGSTGLIWCLSARHRIVPRTQGHLLPPENAGRETRDIEYKLSYRWWNKLGLCVSD